MKRIYFLRHAKAEEKAEGGDFYRKLSKKGKQDIKLLSTQIQNLALKPERIISSPALRASKTAKEFALALSCDNIIFEELLYQAGVEGIIKLIKEQDDNFKEIMLVGHNPSLKESIETLGRICLNSFATCSLLCLEFEVQSFKDIQEHSAKLVFFHSLKDLKSLKA